MLTDNYKVGDYVRVLGVQNGAPKDSIGKVHKVYKVAEGYDYLLDNTYYYTDDELTLAYPNTSTGQTAGGNLRHLDGAANDVVNRPSHYAEGGIECIEYIKERLTSDEYRGYLYGNAIKYNHRWPNKNGAEDLAKAAWYNKALQGVLNEEV